MKLSYTDHKRQTLARLRRLWVLGSLLLGASALWLSQHLLPDSVWTLFKLLGAARKGSEAADKLGLPDLWTLLAVGSLVASLAVATWRSRQQAARVLHERLFDRFNTEVLLPIRRPAAPVAGQPPLPWIAPSAELQSGGRLAVWQAMQAWVHRGADLRSDAEDRIPFAWALLVGRPGAGKSRTADELARGLARRDLLGDAVPPATGWRAGLLRRRLAWGALLRRALRRPAQGDPWDAGRPAHRSGAGTELIQASEAYKRRFDGWRPRAPTLIVFEDPRAEEAAHLIQWLAAKTVPGGSDGTEPAYRFPVRLLIVNQTLPADLKLEPLPGGGWGSRLPHLGAAPWLYNEASYLSLVEWRELTRAHFGAQDRRRLSVDEAAFGRLTRHGHPLLVESLVNWLAGHPEGSLPAVEALTPADLLGDRARRVLTALQAAQVDKHEQWCLLAAASLVGGLALPTATTPASASAGQPTIDAGALQRVFPDEDVQLRIPPVRPDLIGQAFCDLVVQTPRDAGVAGPAADAVQADTARRVATLAWQCDAFGVLNALDKLLDHDASHDFGPPGPPRQRVIAALEAGSHGSTAVDAATLARAFARLHLLRGRSLAPLRQHIAAAPAAAALSLATVELFDYLAAGHCAARDTLAVFSLACERVLGELHGDAAVVGALWAALERLARALGGRGEVQMAEGTVPTEGFGQLGCALALHTLDTPPVDAPTAWRASADVERALTGLWRCRVVRESGLRALSTAFSRLAPHPTPSQAAAWCMQAMSVALEPDRQRIQMLRSAAWQALPVEPDVALASRCAFAMSLAAFALAELSLHADIDGCVESIRQIAEPYGALPPADRRALAEHHATALRCAAYVYAHGTMTDSIYRCARAIGELARPYDAAPLADRLELVTAQVRTLVNAVSTHGNLKQADQARDCVQAISDLIEPFHALPPQERRNLAVWHAKALSDAAAAGSDLKEPERATSLARAIARLSADFDDLLLADRRELVKWHARTLAIAGHIHANLGQADAARHCAQSVASLIEPFAALPAAERCTLVEQELQAWIEPARAYLNLKQAEQVHACAQTAGRLIEPFEPLPLSERRRLAEPLANVVVFDASAYADQLNTGQVERCANSIARLSKPFSNLPLIERRFLALCHCQTFSHAAWAHGMQDEPDAARRCVQTISQLAAPFTALPLADALEFAACQAGALVNAAYAYGRLKQHAEVQRCADDIAGLIQAFDALPQADRQYLVDCLGAARTAGDAVGASPAQTGRM